MRLGVLCELYRRETRDGKWIPMEGDPGAFDFYAEGGWPYGFGAVPDSVRWWAEMTTETWIVRPLDGNWGATTSLLEENGNGDDFSFVIACVKENAERI